MVVVSAVVVVVSVVKPLVVVVSGVVVVVSVVRPLVVVVSAVVVVDVNAVLDVVVSIVQKS